MTVLMSDGRKNLEETIHHILDTYLSDEDFRRGIFIKPNIVFPVKPGSGEITSPLLVKALISAFKERYNNIDIILGEGVAAGCDPQENFRISGYARLARELDVPLQDLNNVERKTVLWKFGKLELPVIALERTYINLPVLKPSSACVISGALKNQKGLLIPAVKQHFHRHGLHAQIAELNAVVKPALTIMDCSNFFGRHVFLSGDNCGEIDAAACQLLEIDEPEHVQLARVAGVFGSGFSLRNENINLKRIAARPVIKEFKRLGRLRLWSNSLACTMCRYIFRDIQQNLLKPQNFTVELKLLSHSIKGAEMIMGTNPHWRKEYRVVICFGNCTRSIARENGYIYIPGCPPTIDDFKKNLPF
jgi:uncharacterized protein (DUF362 family)